MSIGFNVNVVKDLCMRTLFVQIETAPYSMEGKKFKGIYKRSGLKLIDLRDGE